jgi:YD repeat-containing protein
VTDVTSGVATYAYNAHNALTSITDPDSFTASWVRDGFQEAIQEASPDRGTTVYYFDSDGNLTKKVDANSNTIVSPWVGVFTECSFGWTDREIGAVCACPLS